MKDEEFDYDYCFDVAVDPIIYLKDRIYTHRINWSDISSNHKLSEPFIREFKNKVSWLNISTYQKLSEPFIREFQDKVSWVNIAQYQKLSEDFIRDFKDRVSWWYISQYQKLSEAFIREFKDRVIWGHISIYQRLSESFIKEFNIENYNILNIIHNCGNSNRLIIIRKDNPNIIEIGCYRGTKEEAIERINNKYDGQEAIDYIAKVEECFSLKVN
jgi:hypothetical protein